MCPTLAQYIIIKHRGYITCICGHGKRGGGLSREPVLAKSTAILCSGRMQLRQQNRDVIDRTNSNYVVRLVLLD